MEHARYDIGDMLPVEVIEKILSSLDTQSAFLRARSVSKNWRAAIDSLIRRNKMPARNQTERIQFVVFKFLSQHRHLLDEPNDTNKGSKKKDKKDKKEKKKKKEKKSKKDKSKNGTTSQPPEPTTEPARIKKDVNWLKSSFEKVLSLPTKYRALDKEKVMLRLWFFAEEEDLIRQYIISCFRSPQNLIGQRIPLVAGYFMMMHQSAHTFLRELEKELMKILTPNRSLRLEVDPARDGYQPTHIDIILDMTRAAVTATANILKLLPSKMIYLLKLMYQSLNNSAFLVLSQFFTKFVMPSVISMFNPRLQTRKKLMPSQYNTRHLHLMAIIIQNGLFCMRIKEPYLERANSFSTDLQTLLVPSFEELMLVELNMNEVNKPIPGQAGTAILLDLEIALEILESEKSTLD